jgi:hypothetical protein
MILQQWDATSSASANASNARRCGCQYCHAVDPARLDVGQQPLQGRALDAAAGEAPVVVAGGEGLPALGLLAGDERLGGLTLGVQRVELLIEPLLAALAGVDGAADAGAVGGWLAAAHR